jgi:serine/threonine protein kinase
MDISRIKSAGAATTTAIGTTCGSPGHIAPECLLWQPKSSTATAIWSLGVTLIEFFSEKDAWNVDNELDAISIIMDKMWKKVSPLQDEDESNINKEVLVLLKGCVNYDNNVRSLAAKILRSL